MQRMLAVTLPTGHCSHRGRVCQTVTGMPGCSADYALRFSSKFQPTAKHYHTSSVALTPELNEIFMLVFFIENGVSKKKLCVWMTWARPRSGRALGGGGGGGRAWGASVPPLPTLNRRSLRNILVPSCLQHITVIPTNPAPRHEIFQPKYRTCNHSEPWKCRNY